MRSFPAENSGTRMPEWQSGGYVHSFLINIANSCHYTIHRGVRYVYRLGLEGGHVCVISILLEFSSDHEHAVAVRSCGRLQDSRNALQALCAPAFGEDHIHLEAVADLDMALRRAGK